MFSDRSLGGNQSSDKYRMVPPFKYLIMKQVFSLLLLLLLYVTASFAGDAQIVIKQKSGGEATLKLSTNPVITFEGANMIVTNDFTTISFPLEFLDSYTVINGTEWIDPVVMKPQRKNGHVIFSGLADGSQVYVYTLDGKVVAKQAANSSSITDVSLESLPKGTYIISTSNNSIKVINK